MLCQKFKSWINLNLKKLLRQKRSMWTKHRMCSVCAPTCFPSCEEPNVPCTKICRQDASAHYCPCAPNYLIGPNGNCIRKDDCPPPAIKQSTEPPKHCSSKECDAQTHASFAFASQKTAPSRRALSRFRRARTALIC